MHYIVLVAILIRLMKLVVRILEKAKNAVINNNNELLKNTII
jgi:hypothetical protein